IATVRVFTWRPACERHSFDRNDSVDSMTGAASLARRLFFVAETLPTDCILIDLNARTMLNYRDEIAVEDSLTTNCIS
ncbi:MAG: hypothetical protein DRQ63_06510, partial [Gammaproteobacteria bacterium]